MHSEIDVYFPRSRLNPCCRYLCDIRTVARRALHRRWLEESTRENIVDKGKRNSR